MSAVYSVVIPCRDGAATLGRQLRALAAQDFTGDFEVVVADNGSRDESRAVVAAAGRTDPRVRGVDASGRPGINHARNVGVAHARGEFVLLCDADDAVTPGWISAMDRARRAGADCVGGAVERRLPDETVVGTDPATSTHLWHVPRPIGANCGFAREVHDAVGGFDESLLGGGDESDFFYRAHLAGYRTRAVPDAVVVYYERERLRDLARQQFRYGRQSVRIYLRFRDAGLPRRPLWRVPVTVAGGLVRALSPDRLVRRRGVKRLALTAGRVAGSVRDRTLFV
ncbi:glycosyltransferase [Promicromonospora sp. NPDC052451]|uniref:glycosyltransferase n=1 Tax=Promicromonospora sp. NPDC052451 TaxID=3364407 RepID=UPI0037C8D020